nr:hypothetical protein CJLB15_00086 [Campylobacter phage CJLB-15]
MLKSFLLLSDIAPGPFRLILTIELTVFDYLYDLMPELINRLVVTPVIF